MKKNWRYIVISGLITGHPLLLASYDDAKNLLLHGDYATLFHSYDAARSAIKRTQRYAKRKGFDWSCHRHRIMRVL